MGQVTPSAGQTVGLARDWIEWLARAGYLAKGVVYVIIGSLAAKAAFDAGGATTGSEGAMATLLRQPFGRVLLTLVAIGLAGYALWRFVQAIKDPEGKGDDLSGFGHRAYAFASGVIHVALVVAAFRMLTGNGGGGKDTRGWTAELMSQPFGRWLVALLGLAVLGGAVAHFVRAHRESFLKRLQLGELNAKARTWFVRAAKGGLVARGVVFAVIGFFFVVAAWRSDPDKAKGLGEALQTLEQQAWGPWLLGLVAVGLVAYGVYQIAKARYRIIHP